MEANVDAASSTVEELQVQDLSDQNLDLDLDLDLDLELADVPLGELLLKVQAVQTDDTTQELGVNTDADWESQVAAMLEYSSSLTEQYNSLMKKEEEEVLAQEREKQQLEKKKEEAIRQYQALLDKLKSVRVKLQLNNSKATRKNFLAKKQEMTVEKTKAEEDNNRLAKELEEGERKLTALTEEQSEEQRRWQEELDALRQEMEQARKEVKEAELLAAQDEIAAVEKQRDLTMDQIEAWLRDVGQYMHFLREFPQQHAQERQRWEKKEGQVRKNHADLQKLFQEQLKQLQEGRELESLPKISTPPLPQIPMAELRFHQLMQSLTRPRFMPPPHSMNRPFLPQRPLHFYPQQFPHPPHFRPRYHHPPPTHYHAHIPPHAVNFQPSQPPQHQPQIRPPPTVTPPYNISPSPPAQAIYPVDPSPPPSTSTSTSTTATTTAAAASAPTGKLDKVLEKLGARFPQCNRAQLTTLLQQVKSSRGTLAGMSMEEVIEQVGFKLAQNERSAPGPISRPSPLGPIQRPMVQPQRGAAGGGQASATRKLCLMCQNHVDPENRHPLSCSHTIHKDCIKMWLQSSKNNSCPFCPAK